MFESWGEFHLFFFLSVCSLPLPRSKGAFFFLVKLEGAFFSFRRLGRELIHCWGGLCPLLLGVRSLHSFQDREATYQDVMELSSREKHEQLGRSSLLVVEHEVEEFFFFLEVEGRTRHLCLKVGESSTFSSS